MFTDSLKILRTMESSIKKPPTTPSLTSSEGESPSRKSFEGLSDSDALLEHDLAQFEHRVSFRRKHVSAIYIHASLMSLYIVTIILLGVSNATLRAKIRGTSLYSPANEAIEWSIAPWPAGDGLSEPYVGYPRPELESAWQKLLGNMNVRISREDVRHFGREENAVALPDGSGYVGTLNVYHEIHCIRWLHKHLYQDIYWPNLDDTKREKNRVHSEHCLSTLRKFALCHGDVGLVTYSWNPYSAMPSANATAHKCIDWEALAQWSAARAVNMFEPGYLVHPVLGPAYPHGEPVRGGPHEEEHTLPPIPQSSSGRG